MSKIEILEEKPLALYEIREKLQDVKKRDKELGFRANKVEEYLNIVTKNKLKKPKDLEKDIESLSISRLKLKQIKKIVDLHPVELDSLRIILSDDIPSLKQEELQKIVEIVKKHVK